MNQDYRFAATAYRNPRMNFGLDDRFSRDADAVANQNQLAQMANMREFQDYARASGPGTRYEQQLEAQQQQALADARERELYAQGQQRERDQYSQQWQRRNDGPMDPAAREDARRYDARLALLRSIMAGQGGWGMPQAPNQPGDDGNALARFIRSRVGY